jgi:hypothetical protein
MKTRSYLAYQCIEKFDAVMREDRMDAYVQVALLDWLRWRAAPAFRTDDEDKRAAQARVRLKALEGQLEEAREQATTFRADGRPLLSVTSLSALEERLEPLIETARAESEVVQAPPLLRKLIGKEDVAERWADLTMEQRRTVLRASVNIRLNRARARGVRRIEPGRIELTFRGEEGFVLSRASTSRRGPGRVRAVGGGTSG